MSLTPHEARRNLMLDRERRRKRMARPNPLMTRIVIHQWSLPAENLPSKSVRPPVGEAPPAGGFIEELSQAREASTQRNMYSLLSEGEMTHPVGSAHDARATKTQNKNSDPPSGRHLLQEGLQRSWPGQGCFDSDKTSHMAPKGP